VLVITAVFAILVDVAVDNKNIEVKSLFGIYFLIFDDTIKFSPFK